jgi:hypothetical protein
LSKPVAAAVLGFALFATSCGVSRTASEETLTDEVAATDEADSGAEETDDAESDAATPPTTSAPEPTPPPTTAPAGDVAITVDFGDEIWELTHGELNEVVIPTWENQEFITRAFGGSVPAGFYSGVANEFLIGRVFDRELAELGGEVTDADEQGARENLLNIMQSWYAGSPDPVESAETLYGGVPYLPFVVGLQASQAAITTALTESDILLVEAPCVRHILVGDEATAQEVLGLLDDGGDFATLAAEYSTGPTGPNGGDLGCVPSDGYVPEFAAAVDAATVGEVVGPVQTQFGWHVLVVEGFEETTSDPNQYLNTKIGDTLASLSVDVDPRLGSWDDVNLSIVPTATD